jgi:predicted nucleotidyltransferase
VRTVRVFGSYLTERDRINDIDIAVELVAHHI